MIDKHLEEYRRRYDIFRHHAWAGTALLSVLFALRYLFKLFPNYLLIPLGSILAVYVLTALVFTYKYRAGLSARQVVDHGSEGLEKETVNAEIAKERFKIEKKRAKAEAKAKKKEGSGRRR